MMKKWINSLVLMAVLAISITSPTTGYSQPPIPEETQIIEFLQSHPQLVSTGAVVVAVRVERGALVIDLSADVLPDGTYDAEIFNSLQADLDREFAINSLFMTTFLIEGQPLIFWGEPQPDFTIMAEPDQLRELPGAGPLAGVRIALSPGHGLYWNESFSAWRWQRLEFWGIREDLVNAEIMRYVKAGLENQGATVIQLRELDFNARIGVTGHPAWHEATRQFAIYQGMPSWVYNGSNNNYNSDIRARPYMANYLGADIFISLHNNGWDGSLRGTETYWDINNHPGSQALANAVHNSVIQTMRSNVDPNWTNRGLKSSNWSYGEIYFAQMPAILLELAFMDNYEDNTHLQKTSFKILSAQAIIRGICQFKGVNCDPVSIVLPQTIEQPLLTPSYTSNLCESGWYGYTNPRGHNAYLSLNENNPTHTAVWQPTLPVSGEYRLEAFIPAHPAVNWQCPNKTINTDTGQAVYEITHANGVSQKVINQAASANRWVNLGLFHFDDVEQTQVVLTNSTGDSSQTTTVSASALRVTLAGNAGQPFYNTSWVDPTWVRQSANAPVEHIRHFLEYHQTCLDTPIQDADGQIIDFSEVIQQASTQNQINPRLLLAIMEASQYALSNCPTGDSAALASLMGLPASTAREQITNAASILNTASQRLESGLATPNGWKTGLANVTEDEVIVTPANHTITTMFDYTQYAGEQWGGSPTVPGVHGIYIAYRDFKLNGSLITGMNPVYLPLIIR